jgi:thioredoxin-related protein
VQKFSRLVLLAVASVSFVVGICGAILFFPGDSDQGSQAQGADTGAKVNWQTSLAAGAAQAKQEHKYVLADVYTDWCGWCKRLDRDVFSKPKVVKYLQDNFICVKVNAEDPKEGVNVATSYKVDGYPCGLVFSPEGKLIGRVGGYEAANDYISTLKQIKANPSSGGDEASAGSER